MWLLYITFEDFICLSYPGQSASILSTNLELNSYLNTQTVTTKRHKSKKRVRDSPDKGTGETCEVDSQKQNLVNVHLNPNEFRLKTGEVIFHHRFARKRRLSRAHRHNTSLEETINRVHGVNDLNSIGSDSTDMPYRNRDRMHDRRQKKDLRSNVTLTKDYGFCDSWKTRQSGDIINKNSRLNDQLVNHNAPEQTPRNKNCPDNRACQHDNPHLKLTNWSLNRSADQCVGLPSGLSPRTTYPQDEIRNDHLNLSCSATNTTFSPNLTNDIDRRNNILNISAFNPGDSKSARFRLKLDLNNPIPLRNTRRTCSKDNIIVATGNSSENYLRRSASFDDVLTPEADMPSKPLSCESSPVTISSGYESDSLPTNEADIDNIFVQGKKKENNRAVPPMELPIDYFSMSDSHPSPHGQPICTGAIVTRKPETFVQNELNEQLQNKLTSKETRPPMQTPRERTDNQNPTRFSPAQINNYQLTKVARSMFEIIHDLQAEKDQENKAKSRKPKRHVQWRKDRTDVIRKPVNNIRDNENIVNTRISQQENREQLQENNQSTPMSAPGKVSVRCLRRPLGSDPSFHNRQILPHSSEFDRQPDEYPDFCITNNSATPPELSRQFSEPEIRNCDIPSNFIMNHSFDSRDMRHQIVFNGCAPYATTKLPGCSPYATTRLPGCHTPRRDDKDDHVYETIPGDDLLQYEEILRMRLQGLLKPRYHPPALPARNINDRKMSEPIRKNFNENFRVQQQNVFPANSPKQNNQTNCSMLSTSCVQNQQTIKPRSFSYDPSDSSRTVPNEFMSRWSAADLLNYIDGIRQPPPKRRENFYFLLDSKQKRACFSESLEIENKIKGMGINLDESRRAHMDEDGYTTMDSDMPPFCGGLQHMQSTYV